MCSGSTPMSCRQLRAGKDDPAGCSKLCIEPLAQQQRVREVVLYAYGLGWKPDIACACLFCPWPFLFVGVSETRNATQQDALLLGFLVGYTVIAARGQPRAKIDLGKDSTALNRQQLKRIPFQATVFVGSCSPRGMGGS